MIELIDVSKLFRRGPEEIRALDGVSMRVGDGEYVAICGPSGSGKSTMLSLIGGLSRPTSGRVMVDAADIGAMSGGRRAAWRRDTVGFVFQMFHLLPYLTVSQNVMAAAVARDPATRADELLKKFGLGDRLAHRPGQLSTGERQRVAMARALVNSPSLLLADEPTGNLDPDNADGVLDLIDEFHRGGGAVVLVTHSADAAARAQRTIEMDQGKIVMPVSAGE